MNLKLELKNTNLEERSSASLEKKEKEEREKRK
jgi:hypothetical protein